MAKFSFFFIHKEKNNTETDKEVTTKNSIERLNDSIDKISDIEDGYSKRKVRILSLTILRTQLIRKKIIKRQGPTKRIMFMIQRILISFTL